MHAICSIIFYNQFSVIHWIKKPYIRAAMHSVLQILKAFVNEACEHFSIE